MVVKEDRNDALGDISGLVLIAILAIIAWAILRRREKEKELAELRERLESNTVLNAALEKRMRTYFTIIRWLFIMSYLIINSFLLISAMVDVGSLLNWNSVVFILISSLTFARFGDFNSYKKWWIFLEIKVEVYIYRKSPELKKLIADDVNYRIELEKEIEELNFSI